MNRIKKQAISLVCVMVLLLAILAVYVFANGTKQDALHEAAEILREAGYDNDSEVIKAISNAWWEEEQKDDVLALAQMAAGEYPWTDTPEQKQQCAAVMWCAIWRAEKGGTIRQVVSAPNQFHGYSPKNAVTDGQVQMAQDVLERYRLVLQGENESAVGCVLPREYLWFYGNGRINIFRNAYNGGKTWDWSWGNPYV